MSRTEARGVGEVYEHAGARQGEPCTDGDREAGPHCACRGARIEYKGREYGSSQGHAQTPVTTSGATDSDLCFPPQPGTSRRPGQTSSETAASGADKQTDGRTERQTDGPKDRQEWLAQRAKLARQCSFHAARFGRRPRTCWPPRRRGLRARALRRRPLRPASSCRSFSRRRRHVPPLDARWP